MIYLVINWPTWHLISSIINGIFVDSNMCVNRQTKAKLNRNSRHSLLMNTNSLIFLRHIDMTYNQNFESGQYELV